MAKNSQEAYGAESRGNLLHFDPTKLELITDPKHALFDERVNLPIDEAMVLNIMHQGVIQPITVRKNRETGKTEVVAGRQRVKNAIEANKRLKAAGLEIKLVPATVKVAEDNALAGVMVSENEIRTADTPIGRAKKMAALRENGNDDAHIALLFGITPQTVKHHFSLLECCAAVRKAVDTGKILVNHAKVLAKLEPAEQQEKLDKLLAAGEGVEGHEKSRKQRAVLDQKPKMKGKKEILEAINCPDEEFDDYRQALRWVIGE